MLPGFGGPEAKAFVPIFAGYASKVSLALLSWSLEAISSATPLAHDTVERFNRHNPRSIYRTEYPFLGVPRYTRRHRRR